MYNVNISIRAKNSRDADAILDYFLKTRDVLQTKGYANAKDGSFGYFIIPDDEAGTIEVEFK